MFRLIRVTVFILFILSYQFIDLRTDAFALTINDTTDYFGSTSTATTGLPSDSCNNTNNTNNAKCFYLLPYGLSQCAVASSSSSFGGMPSSINYTTTPTTTYPYGKLAAIILANYNFGWGRISDPSSDIELGSCRKDPIGACHDTLLICEEDTDIGAAFLILSIVYGENPPSGQYSVTSAQQKYPDSTHMSPKSYITSVSVTTGTIRKFETIMMYYSSNNLLCNDNYDEPKFDAAWSGTQNDSIDANNDIQKVPPRTLPDSGGPAPVPSWVFISPSSGKTCVDINNTTSPSDGWILGSIMFECANLTRQPAPHGLAGYVSCDSLVLSSNSDETIKFTLNYSFGSGAPPLPLGPATVSISGYAGSAVTLVSPSNISSGKSEVIELKNVPASYNQTIVATIIYDGISSSPPDCSTTIIPTNTTTGPEPYVTVNGGDVMVGSAFENNGNCTLPYQSSTSSDYNKDPGVLSVNNNLLSSTSSDFYNTSIPAWSGSSDNLALFAPGIVNGFSTGANSSSTADDLTFSNSNNIPYGGNLGTSLCSQDYYSTRNTVPSVAFSKIVKNESPNTNTFNLNLISLSKLNQTTPFKNECVDQASSPTSDSTIYCYINVSPGGDVNIEGSLPSDSNPATTGVASKLVLYVNGNSYITGSSIKIYYNSKAIDTANDIPLFYLIDSGNIYVDSGVSTLQGTYVAQSNSNSASGIIYTCAVKSTNLSSYVSMCDNNPPNPLNIEGSLVANQIEFGRLSGGITLNGSVVDPAAETIDYSPLEWLSQVQGSSLSTNPSFQDVTQLSPVV